MTIWKPALDPAAAPLYLALAEAITRDVESGRLAAGTRLPTHRDLARRLGVNVGTITRAYAEAARRGLVGGEVGRGSYVRHPAVRGLGVAAPAATPPGLVDFAFNVPAGRPSDRELREGLARVAALPALGHLVASYRPAGLPEHREAGARWMARAGVEAPAERTLILGGAQHGMAVSFATLTRPGDGVLCESLSYPGFRALAKVLGLRIHAVAIDEHGMDPDSLDAVARSSGAKVLYTMPSVHNPTGAVLPEARRREVARIARERDLTIVEDDSFGFLCWSDDGAPLPPLAALAPERTHYLASLSKSVAAGLRVAYLCAPSEPADIVERLLAASNAIAWMAAPLMAELAAQWIADGTAERIAREKRAEARVRQRMARRVLALPADETAASCHLWLALPEPWRSSEFVASCRERGVAVTSPEPFAVGRANAPHAVRVCIGTPTRAECERGLAVLAAVLREAPETGGSIV